MADEADQQSYTAEDEENDNEYSSMPIEAIDDEGDEIDDDALAENVYESPVGDMDTTEIDEETAEEEEDIEG